MQPHKNSEQANENMKALFKPKVMLADLHKPNCEFTSDLQRMAHNTRLVKKAKAKSKTVNSPSLN